MKKSMLFFSLLLVAVISTGCTHNKTEITPENEKIENSISVQPLPAPETTEELATNTKTDEASTSAVKAFTMTAKNWEFIPSVITVNEGDQVKLTIQSVDVEHGINIPDFNIKAKITPGADTIVEFKADKKGTFSFFCSVWCGEGHKGMTGTIIVQ